MSTTTVTLPPVPYRRRDLLRAGAVGTFAIIAPRLVRGTEANSAVRVGLLGCGRRGSTDATSIAQHTPARVVALADLFPDALEKGKQRFDKLAESKGYAGVARTFVGPDAYRQIAESADVDAVVIATPAYYHPEHLAAVVAGGKHVYCEKPVAVDVAGAKRVLEIGRNAAKVSLDVGFQIRSAPPFVELVRRIHAGALGDIRSGTAHYFCPLPDYPPWPGVSAAQARLRNWLSDRVLSGDIIVEQNIHAIDICNWVLDAHPLSAIGRGGPEGRNGAGDVYSHFDVVFRYPKAIDISFASTQFGKGKFDVDERFFGTRGSSASPYSGALGIEGEEPWTWEGSEKQPASVTFSAAGTFEDNLAHADEEKHKAFIGSIVSGQFHNQAATGVETALTAMLGREAAYRKREVTWEELNRLKQHWDAGIDLRKL
ncbi:MAG: Gfo/Idh/MocA family protein [Bryobacteraceae bacterium]|jgi:predicted dehydrogenase